MWIILKIFFKSVFSPSMNGVWNVEISVSVLNTHSIFMRITICFLSLEIPLHLHKQEIQNVFNAAHIFLDCRIFLTTTRDIIFRYHFDIVLVKYLLKYFYLISNITVIIDIPIWEYTNWKFRIDFSLPRNLFDLPSKEENEVKAFYFAHFTGI